MHADQPLIWPQACRPTIDMAPTEYRKLKENNGEHIAQQIKKKKKKG